MSHTPSFAGVSPSGVEAVALPVTRTSPVRMTNPTVLKKFTTVFIMISLSLPLFLHKRHKNSIWQVLLFWFVRTPADKGSELSAGIMPYGNIYN
jgi:hypothetical protein